MMYLHIVTEQGKHLVVNESGFMTTYPFHQLQGFSGEWIFRGLQSVKTTHFEKFPITNLSDLNLTYRNGRGRWLIADTHKGVNRTHGDRALNIYYTRE